MQPTTDVSCKGKKYQVLTFENTYRPTASLTQGEW